MMSLKNTLRFLICDKTAKRVVPDALYSGTQEIRKLLNC